MKPPITPTPTPPWLAQAAAMPVAFAQVWEDPRVDLAAVDLLDRKNCRGVMIASGGCTAASLVAAGRFSSLHLVDLNPAQLELTRLKLHLLNHESTPLRLQLCGHEPMADREDALRRLFGDLGLPADGFGPLRTVGQLGLDQAGRYELLFAELRRMIVQLQARSRSDEFNGLQSPNPTLDENDDAAFDRVMALENLVALFGEKATQNRVEPFSRHFARRTRVALATLPVQDNPFLWQLLAGRFPPGVPYDWFTAPPPARLPELHFLQSAMSDALAGFESAFDFVHLSNILDWLSPAEVAEALARARRALKPGGLTIIRQLNSSLDLHQLGPGFDWLTEQAAALHAVDRSFFYRRLYLGRRS